MKKLFLGATLLLFACSPTDQTGFYKLAVTPAMQTEAQDARTALDALSKSIVAQCAALNTGNDEDCRNTLTYIALAGTTGDTANVFRLSARPIDPDSHHRSDYSFPVAPPSK